MELQLTAEDEVILTHLTHNGETPLDRLALVGGLIRAYIPNLGWLPVTREDNRMAVRCEELLRRLGREYPSLERVPPPNS